MGNELMMRSEMEAAKAEKRLDDKIKEYVANIDRLQKLAKELNDVLRKLEKGLT